MLVPGPPGVFVLLPGGRVTRSHQAQADAQQEQAEQGCNIADRAFVNQHGGTVTMNGVGVTVAANSRYPYLVLQRRLDPEIVIAKGVPADNTPRNPTNDQRQAPVRTLVASGKLVTVAVTADPDEPDAAN